MDFLLLRAHILIGFPTDCCVMLLNFARRASGIGYLRARLMLLVVLLSMGASIQAAPSPTAQDNAPEMIFSHLGADQGLNHGSITAIAQDSRGFLWFASEDGLDRYDGYEFKQYVHNRNAKNSLPNNWISALTTDKQGVLWIGSDGGGVVRRDESTDAFQALQSDNSPAAPGDKIRAMYTDQSGRVWIGTKDAGVIVHESGQKADTRYAHVASDPTSLSAGPVYAFAEDSGGLIWVGTGAGLSRINPRTGKVESFTNQLRALATDPNAPLRVNALLVDSRGVLWVGLESGLVRFDVTHNKLEKIQIDKGKKSTAAFVSIYALLEDETQHLWAGSSNGLVLVDKRTLTSRSFVHDPTDHDSLPDNNVMSLFQDRSGLIWIGTKFAGAARWNPRSWSFGHHRLGADEANNVTSFTTDANGNLWAGSFGGGLRRIDHSTDLTRVYRHNAPEPFRIDDDNIMALATDANNRIWIGTLGAGLNRLDAQSGSVTHFPVKPKDPNSLPTAGIMCLFRDSSNRMWVGTYGAGLVRIDPESDRVIRYPFNHTDEAGLSGDRATTILEDRSGLIWIGTDGNGLSILDPKSGRFVHYLHSDKNPKSLAADTLYALHQDKRGVIWIGTQGAGMDQVSGEPFSTTGLKFQNFADSDGLPNNTIYGIEENAQGDLWLSTNRGLAEFKLADHTIRSFHRNHGLQRDEFNFGAHHRATDGTLYFGGSNGYNRFRPEQLETNERAPDIALTQVLKGSSPIPDALSTLKKVDLSYRDSSVTFRFAGLDFASPTDNRYAYRLDGFDTDWKLTDGIHQATYTNLNGGHYLFQVRAANSDGHWSSTPLQVALTVQSPPWATWWARTLYVLLLVGGTFAIWRYQQNRIKREAAYAQRLKGEVDARTAELEQRNKDLAVLNDQLLTSSVSDSLTGLGNRRRLRDRMAQLYPAQSNRAQDFVVVPAVLMVIDLDNLKPVNDRFGHEAGDALLVQVSDALKQIIRGTDLIVRWGGDEFVALCEGADLKMATILAERVRSAIAKQIFRVGNGQVVRASCSIGFAPLPFIPNDPNRVDWEQSLALADAALYVAKRERNTWVGVGGTHKTGSVSMLAPAIVDDLAKLENDELIIVERRPWSPNDTSEFMRPSAKKNITTE